ncbi:Ribosomal protein S10 mitochondrial [Bienertia sinuspersici]
MSTKIRVVLSSFTRPLFESLPPHTRRVGLPETKKIYIVLRSPHTDKKIQRTI